MMRYASIYEAKTQLSKYVSMIEDGSEEEIVILKNGKKVAKIVLYEEKNETRRLGAGLLFSEAKPFVLKQEGEDFGGLFGY